MYEKARAANYVAFSVPCRLLVSSRVNVSVIHPSEAAAAYHAIDTIDRLWSHERSNLGYGTRFSIVIVSWKVTSTWLILARGQSAVVSPTISRRRILLKYQR